MNPKKFGSLANHDQECRKAPLPEFIENLYFKRFGKTGPDEVLSIEDLLKQRREKQEKRKARKLEATQHSEADYEIENPF